MKNKIMIFLLKSVFCVILFSSTVTAQTVKSDALVIDRAIQRSAAYLMNSVRNDGQFEYRINMNSAIRVEPKYNILRHSGSLFSMATYYKRNPTTEMKAAIDKASDYLVKQSIGAVEDKEDMLAVWSKPEVARNRSYLQAKLGGTGLGLVALLSVDSVGITTAPLKDLQALGNFLIYMQNSDGSFVSKFIPALGGKQSDWQSLYYPGEAALGLVMLYEKDGDVKWLVSAAKTLQFLANKRKGIVDVEADHWALLATQRLLSAPSFSEVGVSKELLIEHAVQITNTILNSQITSPVINTELYGGFTNDGRVTPAATRLEGLQAAYQVIPKTHKINKRLARAIPLGIKFLIQSQVTEGEFVGAFPRSVMLLDEDSQKNLDFNRRATEVRIDYVQHALSALMQYQESLELGF